MQNTYRRQVPNIFKLIQIHFYSSAEISLVYFMSLFSIVFFPINILNSNLTILFIFHSAEFY